jgi:hypothetical protein
MSTKDAPVPSDKVSDEEAERRATEALRRALTTRTSHSVSLLEGKSESFLKAKGSLGAFQKRQKTAQLRDDSLQPIALN